jgi:nucleoside-diphosphate-sugar epimerase
MQVVIFGANGPTGRLLTRRVLDDGHSVVAITRRPGDFPFTAPALTVAGADVHDVAEVTDVVGVADAVLSTLGVPFTRRPVDTYSIGTRNIVAAMRKTGTRRLVVVSSSATYPSLGRTGVSLTLRLVEPVITKIIGKTVYDDMRRMETLLRDSALDWTIVRPSTLFDLPEVTDYLAGQIDPVGAFTARIDLADYLAAQLTDATTVRRTVVVSTTRHTPTLLRTIRREAFGNA